VAKALSEKPDNLVTLRQPILYAEAMWRKQRTWVLLLIVLGVVMSATMIITRRGQFDTNAAIWLIYIAAGLAFGGLLLLYRRRNYAEVTEEGLRVSNLLRSVVIDYDLVRSARVQKLDMHFQDKRKRYVRPISKPLLEADALFVRLRVDDPRTAEIRRRLGTQLASEDTVALPMREPYDMAGEITSRLPERTGVNLGGQRRRKRSRAR
jgi:hypothetical protein